MLNRLRQKLPLVLAVFASAMIVNAQTAAIKANAARKLVTAVAVSKL